MQNVTSYFSLKFFLNSLAKTSIYFSCFFAFTYISLSFSFFLNSLLLQCLLKNLSSTPKPLTLKVPLYPFLTFPNLCLRLLPLQETSSLEAEPFPSSAIWQSKRCNVNTLLPQSPSLAILKVQLFWYQELPYLSHALGL